MEKNTNTIWANETNGMMTCTAHAGAYLSSAITARPKARTHSTPLGKWFIMSADFVAEMSDKYGAICDGCRLSH